jgi:excisionase family DNA binding protein
MAQTLRDWYRYLERQMQVSFPVVPPDSSEPPGPPGRPAGMAVPSAPRPVVGVPRAVLEAEAHAEAVRRRLAAGTDQSALPLELGPRARGRGGRRPITESREEIIRRLLDPELTLYEAAAVLNLSKATVRRYTDQGKVPCLRTDGGQRRFRLSALLTFLDEQSQSRGGPGGG